MGLVIDTNVFIDAENGRFDLAHLGNFEPYGDAFITAVTVSELLTGVLMAKTPETKIRRSAFVESIISRIPVLDFNEEVARVYAEIYSHLLRTSKRGEGSAHDLQIAATAVTYDYPVLTSNVADFKKVPGVVVLSPYGEPA